MVGRTGGRGGQFRSFGRLALQAIGATGAGADRALCQSRASADDCAAAVAIGRRAGGGDPGPDARDAFEINWRGEEHAEVCTLLAGYGRQFAAADEPLGRVGDTLGDALRVEIPAQRYERDVVLPNVEGDWSLYRIPPQAYTRAWWINYGYWRPERGFASVYAKDHGFFEYAFAADSAAVLAARLKVRLSTDFPPIPGADSLGRSEVRVLLNGAVLGTVLVRPRRYYGTVHEIAIERGRDAPLCYLTSGDNILRFEVPKDVPHQNGIADMSSRGTTTRLLKPACSVYRRTTPAKLNPNARP